MWPEGRDALLVCKTEAIDRCDTDDMIRDMVVDKSEAKLSGPQRGGASKFTAASGTDVP